MNKGDIYNAFEYGELSENDFQRLRDFIYHNFGINILPKKKYLLKNRLIKRLKELEMPGYKEYVDYVLHANSGDEVYKMLNVVSTNKTDFFREPGHFDFVRDTAVPFFTENGYTAINAWSAGCSSGQEAYSLAMVLQEELEHDNISNYTIYGNDISIHILDKAVKAVYPYSTAEQIPPAYRRKYLLKSKDKKNPRIRIAPEIRKHTRFLWLNLAQDRYPLPKSFQIIFCRNTLIYFDDRVKEKVINNLTAHLVEGGFLIIGHSESLINIKYNNLQQVSSTIYQKTETK